MSSLMKIFAPIYPSNLFMLYLTHLVSEEGPLFYDQTNLLLRESVDLNQQYLQPINLFLSY